VVSEAERAPAEGPLDAAVVNEAKLTCTQGMLLCLDRPQRLAYILGEILDTPSDDAAAILGIEPATYRKRLSRARASMEAFLAKKCGVARPENACRCAKLAPVTIRMGILDAEERPMSQLPIAKADALRLDIEQTLTAAEVYRRLPVYRAPDDLSAVLRRALAGIDPSS
jgi:hypothetical protein